MFWKLCKIEKVGSYVKIDKNSCTSWCKCYYIVADWFLSHWESADMSMSNVDRG